MSVRTIFLAAALGLAATATLAGAALAETVQYKAVLRGSNEVPRNGSPGTGSATVTLDTSTRKIEYTVTFADLTSPATMAHIHGPAHPGNNAGVLVNLGANPTSPLKGEAELTPEQVKQLQDGLLYVNVHTQLHPAGELRGQLRKAE
jgi:hypothetical protein